MKLVLTLFLVAATSVFAQTSSTEAGGVEVTEAPAETTKVLRPLRADARLTIDSDIISTFQVGVNADLGLVKLGPGVLAVGAGLDFGFCTFTCLLLSAVLDSAFNARGTRYGYTSFFPQARVSYHLELPAKSDFLKKLDVYGFLFGGVVISSLGFRTNVSGVEISATSTGLGPGIGAGAGASYFLGERVLVGAEATVKYAAGVYRDVAVIEPPGSTVRFMWNDTYSSWSLNWFGLRLFLGFRI